MRTVRDGRSGELELWRRNAHARDGAQRYHILHMPCARESNCKIRFHLDRLRLWSVRIWSPDELVGRSNRTLSHGAGLRMWSHQTIHGQRSPCMRDTIYRCALYVDSIWTEALSARGRQGSWSVGPCALAARLGSVTTTRIYYAAIQ